MHRAELLETAYEQLKEKVEEEMRQKSSHSSQKQLSKSIVDLTEVLMLPVAEYKTEKSASILFLITESFKFKA